MSRNNRGSRMRGIRMSRVRGIRMRAVVDCEGVEWRGHRVLEDAATFTIATLCPGETCQSTLS